MGTWAGIGDSIVKFKYAMTKQNPQKMMPATCLQAQAVYMWANQRAGRGPL